MMREVPTFAGIRLQDDAVTMLRRFLLRRRLHQTYIFAGPPSVGRRRTALALAAWLQCLHPVGGGVDPTIGGVGSASGRDPAEGGDFAEAGERSGGFPDACGNCESCRRLAGGFHPDVTVVRPRGIEIRVDQVRQLQDDAALKPGFGAWRIFIIDPAELLNESAANCLLKTLEEAPPRVMFVLIATAARQLLPTIRSRALTIEFASPRPSAVREALSSMTGRTAAEVAWATGLVDGRFGQALQLLRAPPRGLAAVPNGGRVGGGTVGRDGVDEADAELAALGPAQAAWFEALRALASGLSHDVDSAGGPAGAAVDGATGDALGQWIGEVVTASQGVPAVRLLQARQATCRWLLQAPRLPAALPLLFTQGLLAAIDDLKQSVKKEGERQLAAVKHTLSPAMARELGEQITIAANQLAAQQLEGFVAGLASWLSDAWRAACGVGADECLNIAHRSDIMAMARIWGPPRLERALRLILGAQHCLRRSVSPALILENLITRLVMP